MLPRMNRWRVVPSEDTTSPEPKEADIVPPPSVASGSVPPPLPPSVEEAYRKKCIELKRRMNEVEESTEVYRLRKERLQRGIRKMRLERAYLLEILGKRMKKNVSSLDGYQGVYDEDSEGSSEAPPTPNEKPLRSKRRHGRPVSPTIPPMHPRAIAPHQAHPISAFESPRDPFRESSYQHVPTTNGHPPMHYQPHPSQLPPNAIIPAMNRVHPHVPSAFEEFLHQYVLKSPEHFGYRNDAEAIDVARHCFQDPSYDTQRRACEELAQQNLRRFAEEASERERMYNREEMDSKERREPRREEIREAPREEEPREGEIEVSRELPPPPPSREGGSGGFTSING